MLRPASTLRASAGARVRRHGSQAFRPDIEGLRAVAVGLVVLFHASIPGFAGGYVGVDVFFVLSGFLITGLLVGELEATGTISLASFYARRARRLLPAALLVLLVTLVASVALLPPLMVPGIAADVAAAAGYVSNMGFAIQATDYFASGQAPSPILHYWSLGVEEQFYLFWPAILLLVAGGATRMRSRVTTAVVLVTGGSFVLSLSMTSASPPWAFFSLPTRAWELGLGATVAIAAPRIRTGPILAASLGWIGLATIVAAGVALDDSVAFPGLAALVPTVGAALVILGGMTPTSSGPARLLGTAVPRFFGRISYSLYLWHWPVLVIPAIVVGAPLPLPAQVGLIGVAVALAALTQRLVEDPLRRGHVLGTLPRRNLATAGGVAMAIVVVAVGVGVSVGNSLHGSGVPARTAADAQSVEAALNALGGGPPATMSPAPAGTASVSPALKLQPTGTVSPGPAGSPPRDRGAVATGAPGRSVAPARPGTPVPTTIATPTPTAVPTAIARPATPDAPVPSDLQPALGDARHDYPTSYLDGCHAQEDGHQSSSTCLYGSLGSATTIALFGDSHALSWFPAIEHLAETQGWRLLSLTMSTCNPAEIPIWVPAWKRVSWECNDWRERAIEELIAQRPSIIVVSGTRGFATTDASGGQVLAGDARTRMWQIGMQRTLGRLVPAAGHVIVLADTPLSRVDPPVCLSQHLDSELACATAVPDAVNQAWVAVERGAAASGGAGFIDTERWVCPSAPCPVVLGNVLVYRDAGHLTATFAAAIGGHLEDAILADVRAGASGAP